MSDHQEQRELQQIRAQVAFGMDVEAFMQSQIGRYLQEKANADRDAAMEALIDVDADDPSAVRKLQMDARCATNVLLWLGEAVSEGQNAALQLIASTD